MLESGEEIGRTVSAISIENLVGKFVNNADLGED
jgi:hypothetical protein